MALYTCMHVVCKKRLARLSILKKKQTAHMERLCRQMCNIACWNLTIIYARQHTLNYVFPSRQSSIYFIQDAAVWHSAPLILYYIFLNLALYCNIITLSKWWNFFWKFGQPDHNTDDLWGGESKRSMSCLWIACNREVVHKLYFCNALRHG